MTPSYNSRPWRRAARLLLATVCCAFLAGCGGSTKKTIHGTVTVAGQRPDSGEIHFVPLGDTPGALNVTKIVDGQYRFDARGGLPPGKFRVQVRALKKTGRMVEENNGYEMVMVEETVRIGPPEYAGENSPLVKEVTPDSDGRIDVDIPTS